MAFTDGTVWKILRNRQSRVILLILVLAAVLRLSYLGQAKLWGDEILSATAQFLQYDRLLEELGKKQSYLVPGADPPGYHVANKWSQVFQPDPTYAMTTRPGRFLLRLFSALCGILSVYFTYRLARRLVGERAAWVPAALLAFSFYSVYYSQENRPYAAVIMLTLLSTWLYLEVVLAGRRRLFPWYALSLAALAYVHYLAASVALIHLAAFFLSSLGRFSYRPEHGEIRQIGKREILSYVYAGLLALFLFSPWMQQALDTMFQTDQYHPFVSSDPQNVLFIARRVLVSTLAHWGCGTWLSLLTYTSLAVIGLAACFRRGASVGILFALFYLAPVVLLFSGQGQHVHPRYFIFGFPIHQLLAGIGVVHLTQYLTNLFSKSPIRFDKRWVAVVLVVLMGLFLLNARALAPYYQQAIKCSSDNCPHGEFCRTYIEYIWDEQGETQRQLEEGG